MTTPLELGRAVLAQQPFSVLLGTELTVLESGRVELQLALKPEHLQQFGYAHGGLVSYLADNALTFAGATALGPQVVTLEMKINYLRPAMGDRLIARAEVLSSGKRQAVCQCRISALADEEKLCAAAQGTILRREG